MGRRRVRLRPLEVAPVGEDPSAAVVVHVYAGTPTTTLTIQTASDPPAQCTSPADPKPWVTIDTFTVSGAEELRRWVTPQGDWIRWSAQPNAAHPAFQVTMYLFDEA